jgi:hypothetical protein
MPRIASVGGVDLLLAEWLLTVYPKGS